jgi:hypothetical protein
MNNSAEIFAIALGLEKPWNIKQVDFNKEKARLHIYVSRFLQYFFCAFRTRIWHNYIFLAKIY